MRVESALGDLAAMESINSSRRWASSSTSRGSPAVSRVYDWLRMVTRTGRFSGEFTATALAGAQLVNLAQQLLDAAAHLLAFGVQHPHFIGKFGGFGTRLGGLLHGSFFLLPQPDDQLHSLLDALLQCLQRVSFLFHRTHQPAASRAALAFSTSKPNPAASPAATSASTLRSSSMPAAFRPCMNLLYEMPACRQPALMRTIHSARNSRFLFLRPT